MLSEGADKDIDHHNSQHTRSLQQSRYVCIDVNLDRDKLLDKLYSEKFRALSRDQKGSDEANVDIPLRFCAPREIGLKRKKATEVQSLFSRQLHSLSQKGSKIETLQKLQRWIEDNIDLLYNDPELKKIFRAPKKAKNVVILMN